MYVFKILHFCSAIKKNLIIGSRQGRMRSFLVHSWSENWYLVSKMLATPTIMPLFFFFRHRCLNAMSGGERPCCPKRLEIYCSFFLWLILHLRQNRNRIQLLCALWMCAPLAHNGNCQSLEDTEGDWHTTSLFHLNELYLFLFFFLQIKPQCLHIVCLCMFLY